MRLHNSRYFCDVSLLVYELVHVKLSTIAAASLYLAFIVYNMPPPSDKFLSDNLLVDAPNVKAVARAMVNPGLIRINIKYNMIYENHK